MKRTIQLLIILFFIILLAFTFNACKDDQRPIDPCEKAVPFEPQFKMGTGVFAQLGRDFLPKPIWSGKQNHIRVVSDTILGEAVFFEANSEYDSVYWRIGQEATYRKGNSIGVGFDQAKGTFNAQMIGFRTPNTLCFPEDAAPDTLSRSFTLFPLDSCRAIGKWSGQYIEENSEIFEINIISLRNGALEIDNIPWRPQFPQTSIIYVPYYHGAFSRADTSSYNGPDYKERRIREANTRIRVHGSHNDSITITMLYKYDNIPLNEQTLQPLTFKGRRIQ